MDSSDKTDWLKSISGLYEKGEIGASIKSLKLYCKKHAKQKTKKVQLLEQRFISNRGSYHKGTLSTEDFNIENTKITEALIHLFEEVRKGKSNQKNSSANIFNIVFLIGTGIFVIWMLVSKFSDRTDNPQRTINVINNEPPVDTSFSVLIFPFKTSLNPQSKEDEGIHFRLLSELENKKNITASIAENTPDNWMTSFHEADSIGRNKEVDIVIWGEVAYTDYEDEKIYLNIKYQTTFDRINRRDYEDYSSGQTEMQPYDYSDLLVSGTLLLPIQNVIDWAVGNKYSKNKVWDKAAESFAKVFASFKGKDSERDISMLRTIAAMHMNNNDFSAAREVLRKAIAIDETNPDVNNQYGMTFFMAKSQVDSALIYMDSAIAVNPNNHTFFSNRSSVHSYLKRPDLAIKDLKREIELAPDFFIAYGNLAGIYEQQGKYQLALEYLDSGITLAKAAGKNNFIQSVYLSRKANIFIRNHERKIPPPQIGSQKNLVTNLGLAKMALDKAGKLNTNPFFYTVLGYYYLANEKFSDAIHYYTVADTVYAIKGVGGSKRANVLNGRGTAYFKNDMYPEAINDYNSAIAFDSTSYAIKKNLANVYQKMRE